MPLLVVVMKPGTVASMSVVPAAMGSMKTPPAPSDDGLTDAPRGDLDLNAGSATALRDDLRRGRCVARHRRHQGRAPDPHGLTIESPVLLEFGTPVWIWNRSSWAEAV